MPSSILLQDATIVSCVTNLADEISVLKSHCLLIEGNRIARIAPIIGAPSKETIIINCKGKIVCPGFVDTHHHVWQSQLKGRHANQNLLQYALHGNLQYSHYTPDDVFWGQLAGCLEIIDSGTTTVVDHAHMNLTREHSEQGLSATVCSGVRSIFCYCLMPRVETWEPQFAFAKDGPLAAWSLEQLEEICTRAPFGDGRVQIGLGFDTTHCGQAAVVDVFRRARRLGAKLITSHYVKDPLSKQESVIQRLENYGVLGRDVLFAHVNNCTTTEAQLLNRRRCSISCTPMTELQMCMGFPVCFSPNTKALSSLGVDCHSNNSCDMMSQMKVALEAERARRNEIWNRNNQWGTNEITVTTKDVFALATIQGARAINMESEIGTLEEGKLADVVIFDARTPGMACAVDEDPVAAIVMHASIRDLETVIVDGRIRKENGDLLPVMADVGGRRREMTWQSVLQEILRSRTELKRRMDVVEVDKMRDEIFEAFLVQRFGNE